MSTQATISQQSSDKALVRKTPGQALFEHVLGALSTAIASFPDPRAGRHNTKYSMKEIAIGGFAVFFMRNKSFLEAQRNMESSQGINNLRCMFGVEEIPTDNHIRSILDEVDPSYIEPVFKSILKYLHERKVMEDFIVGNRNILIALDGTQYHSSRNISCEKCNKAEHSNGSVTFAHTAILPVIVKPGKEQILSLFPEFIVPQDGHAKQDCEIAAAKRLISRNADEYRRFNAIILGDDLYCNQPFCLLLYEEALNFIFTCKPTSHKILFEFVDCLTKQGGVASIEIKRKEKAKLVTDKYRFANKVPIRAGADAIDVNWCEITTVDSTDKVLYHNSFATSISVSKDNVASICQNGRARWKIENENNNVLKNLGYNFEHNFGHGQQYLASLLATFNILAFLIHSSVELVDEDFQKLVSKLRRSNIFKHAAVLTCYVCFGGFQDMVRFMSDSFDQLNQPPTIGEIFFHPAFRIKDDSS